MVFAGVQVAQLQLHPVFYTICSTPLGATPIVNDATNYCEKSPLLKRCSAQVECEEVCDSKNASDQHLAKDFQLIHVPKGAVSANLQIVSKLCIARS